MSIDEMQKRFEAWFGPDGLKVDDQGRYVLAETAFAFVGFCEGIEQGYRAGFRAGSGEVEQ